MNVAKNAIENGILGRTAVGIWCQKPQIAPQMFSLFIFLFFSMFVSFTPIHDFYMCQERYWGLIS